MLKENLLEIIKNGENSGVEFKLDNIRPEQLAKEIVALANLQGGIILLGVSDDGKIQGIERENLEEWVMDTVFSRYIHPMILPFYEEISIENKKVAVISFSTGISKPYVVRNNDREEVYIRVGSTSRLATREQQARLYAIGGMLHTEIMPVPGTSIESLDMVRIKNYIYDVLREPEKISTEKDWINRLTGLGFLIEGSDNKVLCTIAGLVLFGINPRRYLKQAGVRIMAFSEKDKGYKALLDEIIDSPLVGRWKISQSGTKELIDAGVIEKFIAALTPFISDESDTIDENLRRDKKLIYPLEAIRETVVNAFAHRDWTRFVDVEVVSYIDRLEIISPGAFQNSMTIEKMIAGQRSARNPIIVEVLRDYGYVDARGMGIRTKVIPLIRKFVKKDPLFEATEDYIKVTLPNIKMQNNFKGAKKPAVNAPINELQKEIIEIIKGKSDISYDELAEKTGKDRTTIMRNIQKLKEIGLVSRIGSKKTGKWITQ